MDRKEDVFHRDKVPGLPNELGSALEKNKTGHEVRINILNYKRLCPSVCKSRQVIS